MPRLIIRLAAWETRKHSGVGAHRISAPHPRSTRAFSRRLMFLRRLVGGDVVVGGERRLGACVPRACRVGHASGNGESRPDLPVLVPRGPHIERRVGPDARPRESSLNARERLNNTFQERRRYPGRAMPRRQRVEGRREAHARAATGHERAAQRHVEAAERARLAGNDKLEAREREFAAKERKAAKRARTREAAAIASIVALGL